jgi:hypothetical protein
MNIALCNKSDNNCPHKDYCKRYIDEVGEQMNMAAVCNSENNYKWLWKVETEIVKSE